MNIEVRHNTTQNGLEVKFSEKPSQEQLDWLYAHRFRYSRFNQVWYTRYDATVESAAQEFFKTEQVAEITRDFKGKDRGSEAHEQAPAGTMMFKKHSHIPKSYEVAKFITANVDPDTIVYNTQSYDGYNETTNYHEEKRSVSDLELALNDRTGSLRYASDGQFRLETEPKRYYSPYYIFKVKNVRNAGEDADERNFYVPVTRKPQYGEDHITADPDYVYPIGANVLFQEYGYYHSGTIVRLPDEAFATGFKPDKYTTYYVLSDVTGKQVHKWQTDIMLSNGIVALAGVGTINSETNKLALESPHDAWKRLIDYVEYYHMKLEAARKAKLDYRIRQHKESAELYKKKAIEIRARWYFWEITDDKHRAFARKITGETEEEQNNRLHTWSEVVEKPTDMLPPEELQNKIAQDTMGKVGEAQSKVVDKTEKANRRAQSKEMAKQYTFPMEIMAQYYIILKADGYQQNYLDNILYNLQRTSGGRRSLWQRQKLYKELTGENPPSNPKWEVVHQLILKWLDENTDIQTPIDTPVADSVPKEALSSFGNKPSFADAIIKAGEQLGAKVAETESAVKEATSGNFDLDEAIHKSNDAMEKARATAPVYDPVMGKPVFFDDWEGTLIKSRDAAVKVFTREELDRLTASGEIDWNDKISIADAVNKKINPKTTTNLQEGDNVIAIDNWLTTVKGTKGKITYIDDKKVVMYVGTNLSGTKLYATVPPFVLEKVQSEEVTTATEPEKVADVIIPADQPLDPESEAYKLYELEAQAQLMLLKLKARHIKFQLGGEINDKIPAELPELKNVHPKIKFQKTSQELNQDTNFADGGAVASPKINELGDIFRKLKPYGIDVPKEWMKSENQKPKPNFIKTELNKGDVWEYPFPELVNMRSDVDTQLYDQSRKLLESLDGKKIEVEAVFEGAFGGTNTKQLKGHVVCEYKQADLPNPHAKEIMFFEGNKSRHYYRMSLAVGQYASFTPKRIKVLSDTDRDRSYQPEAFTDTLADLEGILTKINNVEYNNHMGIHDEIKEKSWGILKVLNGNNEEEKTEILVLLDKIDHEIGKYVFRLAAKDGSYIEKIKKGEKTKESVIELLNDKGIPVPDDILNFSEVKQEPEAPYSQHIMLIHKLMEDNPFQKVINEHKAEIKAKLDELHLITADKKAKKIKLEAEYGYHYRSMVKSGLRHFEIDEKRLKDEIANLQEKIRISEEIQGVVDKVANRGQTEARINEIIPFIDQYMFADHDTKKRVKYQEKETELRGLLRAFYTSHFLKTGVNVNVYFMLMMYRLFGAEFIMMNDSYDFSRLFNTYQEKITESNRILDKEWKEAHPDMIMEQDVQGEIAKKSIANIEPMLKDMAIAEGMRFPKQATLNTFAAGGSINKQQIIQEAIEFVHEVDTIAEPSKFTNGLTIPKVVTYFFNRLPKGASKNCWSVYGDGLYVNRGWEINNFFVYVNNVFNKYGNWKTDLKILEDKGFEMQYVQKADFNRIWFVNGVFFSRTVGSFKGNANKFYAGTQVSIRDVKYVYLMDLVNAEKITLEEAHAIEDGSYVANSQHKELKEGGQLAFANKNIELHLPVEIAVYVPSTRDANVQIPEIEIKERVDEVTKFLAATFGGFSESGIKGGYEGYSGELIKEDVQRVVSFSTKDSWTKNRAKLVNKIVNWCSEWGQESIGVEVEGDMYYINEGTKFADGGNVDLSSMSEEELEIIYKKYGTRKQTGEHFSKQDAQFYVFLHDEMNKRDWSNRYHYVIQNSNSVRKEMKDKFNYVFAEGGDLLDSGQAVIKKSAVQSDKKYSFDNKQMTVKQITDFLHKDITGHGLSKSNEKCTDGCIVQGASHANGGVPFIIDNTQNPAELEGNEIVADADVLDSNKTYEFQGSQMGARAILNKLNTDFGGRPI